MSNETNDKTHEVSKHRAMTDTTQAFARHIGLLCNENSCLQQEPFSMTDNRIMAINRSYPQSGLQTLWKHCAHHRHRAYDQERHE